MAQHRLDISMLENMIVGESKLLSEAETLVTWLPAGGPSETQPRCKEEKGKEGYLKTLKIGRKKGNALKMIRPF
jgi:hypothetical protein